MSRLAQFCRRMLAKRHRCTMCHETELTVDSRGTRHLVYAYRCSRCGGCYACEHTFDLDGANWCDPHPTCVCVDGVTRDVIQDPGLPVAK